MRSFNSYMADRYFAGEMQKKIFLLNRRTGETSNFWQHRVNPGGGYCYFLSVLALLGLKSTDRRFCGIVNTIPREGYRVERNYKHSWVEFIFQDKAYIYDPLVDGVILRSAWHDFCDPREITSDLTQEKLLQLYLTDRYAYKITNSTWQFKPEIKELADVSEEKNGYIFRALQKGHLTGYLENGTYDVSIFIADEPRLYY